MRPDTRFQINRSKKSARPSSCEILYTDSQNMLVLSTTIASRYYKCCTEYSTSPGNYEHLSYVGMDLWTGSNEKEDSIISQQKRVKDKVWEELMAYFNFTAY
jgi:hypothetical protein